MSEVKTEAKTKGIQVNINKEIKKRDGDVIREAPSFRNNFEFCDECAKKVTEAEGDAVTVKSIIVEALDSLPRNPEKGEKEVTAKEKLRRGLLAEKIYKAIEPVELSVDDLSLIKKLVGKIQTPLVVSQVFPELDPKCAETEEE